MADPRSNLQRNKVSTFNPTAGNSAGSRVSVVSIHRGIIEEVGFVPASLVASTMTIAVSVNAWTTTTTASNFTQVVTSTLGSFTSQQLFEGAVASVAPATAAYVNPGDVIQFTTSGNLAAVGAEVYALIRRD